MSSIEVDRCDFCNKLKPVLRTYLYPSMIKSDYFIIVKYCEICGKPKIK